MKSNLSGLILIIALSGCETMQGEPNLVGTTMHHRTNNHIIAMQDEKSSPQLASGSRMSPYQASIDFQNDYQQRLNANRQGNAKNNNNSVRNVNDYVRGIMQDLVANLQYVNQSTPLAVTSFVDLDSDFSTSSLLGNQLAESFVHEIHKFGIPVIDYKATDFIRVTPQGDFVLSRDFTELTPNLPVKYVLTGTLVKQRNGTLVNARIVGMKSKAVVASAQGFLPSDTIDTLLNTELGKKIQLVNPNSG